MEKKTGHQTATAVALVCKEFNATKSQLLNAKTDSKVVEKQLSDLLAKLCLEHGISQGHIRKVLGWRQ